MFKDFFVEKVILGSGSGFGTIIPHSTRPKVSDPTGSGCTTLGFVFLFLNFIFSADQKIFFVTLFPEVLCSFDKIYLFIRDLKTTRAVIPAVRRRRGRSAPPANQLITAVRSKSTFSVSVPLRHTEPVFMGTRCPSTLPLMSESDKEQELASLFIR